jgi:putative ubiquitin-RnfH superfamily antitoxin RatB of RatAB toxin-antitoxin module
MNKAEATAPTRADAIDVEVVYSPAPRELRCVPVRLLPDACTVQDALRASGLWASLGEGQADPAPAAAAARDDDWRGLRLAVFGAKVGLQTQLASGDRLDVCRPLRVDPKLARRERFNQQGARTSGLFAKRRPGGVAGY